MEDFEKPKAEQIPENIRDLGVSQEYFDRLHGLFKLANEKDFMAFFRVLQQNKITINF